VLFVCCLIVVPLPPGENPFAVNNNNNNNNNNKNIVTCLGAETRSSDCWLVLLQFSPVVTTHIITHN
jgi:hypothetical protein